MFWVYYIGRGGSHTRELAQQIPYEESDRIFLAHPIGQKSDWMFSRTCTWRFFMFPIALKLIHFFHNFLCQGNGIISYTRYV